MRRAMDVHPGDMRSGRGNPGDADRLNAIRGLDDAQIGALIRRLENSHTLEHLIYREAELDEVWRLVEAALREAARKGGSGELREVLTALREAVEKVHDLVGDDDDAIAAAQELRRSIFLVRKYGNLINR
jgi:hypothetical protein